MAMICDYQPKLLGQENMVGACNRKRKVSTDTTYDLNDLEKVDNKILRTAILKKRYATMILKSQQVLGIVFDEKDMKRKADLLEKQLLEEKAKSRLREREAARIAIASIKRTVDFNDGLQAEREFLAIIGAPNRW
ncbi:hypothetical protein HAX54_031458 [Datura stramonium]|uniref:Uncharacterized protein n=1 Tax=Datura stramonium TaxID=4076 RepID=A0ABS8SBZ2_DATST|nr:hypothetical protein [Datura stramonium]